MAEIDELVRQGDVAGLVALTQPDQEKHVRFAATVGLGKTGDVAALPMLLAAYDDPDLRHAAVIGLGRLGHEDALPLLLKARDERETRTNAIGAIGRVGGDEALAALRAMDIPWWMPFVRKERADALVRAEGRERELRLPLEDVQVAGVAGLAALLIADAIVVAFAVGVLGADSGRLLIVAGACVVLRSLWDLRRNPAVPAYRKLTDQAQPHAPPLPVEPPARTFARTAAPGVAVVAVIDIILVWLGSLVVDAAVAGGVVIGTSSHLRFVVRFVWLRRWGARTRLRLLRESRDPFEGERRTFSAPR